jgi:hypothetical protein
MTRKKHLTSRRKHLEKKRQNTIKRRIRRMMRQRGGTECKNGYFSYENECIPFNPH